ncbi:regulatory protein-like protein suaprga1 [Conidiobolus coronatus NRRL 28638]|uniref:Regulatory protein-like protein suaprga1 n=1 Tax=Conidiobolus coronatus (strain ATCC 28846 / CBS 209.66 / NRRL 28638) TaxID=796925 RepID=A0A137PG20_CONC2|nr:regulatory protein-like protein suaprga1 [Conidiobolus coronatus NRRL 28638]|eukprot:KXN73938.1 regulatory protein-like protein suaprga1 [Conidiobolus coronatus NRRL 28638]
MIARTAVRNLSKLALRNSLRQVKAAAPLAQLSARTFATTSIRAASAGLVDTDLAHKLNEELQFEKEEGDIEISEAMKEYIDKSPFKIQDTEGHDEVTLTRQFGNEKVDVIFSIKDIGSLPVDDVDTEAGEVADDLGNAPIRCAIIISKPNGGSLSIDAVIDSDYFNIEALTFFKDGKLAAEDTAEADWSRRAVYGGPIFADLDESLQILFERYLQERGITTDLALFIPNYIQYKEQKEYLKWLNNVHDFIKA